GAPVIVKAVAGGGGRGMRVVRTPEEIEDAVKRASSEAKAAFGNGAVYIERLVERARHIEVQVIGDPTGEVVHLGERDCSIQRRHQKLVEIAPSPGLPAGLRDRITAAAVKLARAAKYESLGTIEFLVDATDLRDDSFFAFIEANPRLQVEHTVTEEVTGVDLVQTQLRIAAGETLAGLGLTQDRAPSPRGFAIQVRVNMETMAPDGSPRPSGGTLTAFEVPSGPGLRTDTFGYVGYKTSPRFDSMLAKVIVHTNGDFAAAAAKTRRALSEFRIEGLQTNIPFLQGILAHPQFAAANYATRFIEDYTADIVAAAAQQPRHFFEGAPAPAPAVAAAPVALAPAAPGGARLAGAKVDAVDPLAVLAHTAQERRGAGPSVADALEEETPAAGPDGSVAVNSLLQGTIVSLDVKLGDTVRVGQQLLVMEAMKMEHVVSAPVAGIVRQLNVAKGDTIYDGPPVLFIEPAEVGGGAAEQQEDFDLDEIRPDLAEVLERQFYTTDAARPEAMENRHAAGGRSARENIDDLIDPGSFVEYGGLVLPVGIPRPTEEVMRRYPADGMVTGTGTINAADFGADASRCAVLAYDYTVLAGTQGGQNHRKTDRLLEVAKNWMLPVVLFTEGGGGRAQGGGGTPRGEREQAPKREPGAREPLPPISITTGQTDSWRSLGRLSGLVPLVGVNSGFSFAGNAALLGSCDVIIATANSSIGMGGPAMIEGGGLGVFRPEEVGPMSIQRKNGVVDIAVRDEAEAVAAAKKYLSYFQGNLKTWQEHDQRWMRRHIPENRLRVYDVRKIIETLADAGTVLELRKDFGLAMVTSFIRIEGRPVGVIANNPNYISGAIDSDASDKAARFMQLCDAFDIPILSLCDTPGIMVGPEVEKTALVRHAARMFVVGSNITVPLLFVVLRKAYGLGAIAMAAGSYRSATLNVSWPTGEFGGMGLEGMVKLGFRAELESIADPVARKERYQELVDRAYQRGKAIQQAVGFGVDNTIDPADTRNLLAQTLSGIGKPAPRTGRKRLIDIW
ncbi:MAG: ATP-grasp domain-containing protein, partial [Dehalococcoidia bacterium]